MATPAKYSEEQLVSILQSGKPNDFGVLYDYFSGALLGAILKVVDYRDVAEDVLQESFVKIWQKRATYDASKGRLYTWLLNICRNSAIDAARSKHIKVASKIQNVEDNVSKINRKTSVSQNEESIGLVAIVDSLLPEQKVIMDMIYFEGYTQEEVSQKLSIPLGTVKTRTRNALMKLRETFKQGVS